MPVCSSISANIDLIIDSPRVVSGYLMAGIAEINKNKGLLTCNNYRCMGKGVGREYDLIMASSGVNVFLWHIFIAELTDSANCFFGNLKLLHSFTGSYYKELK